jgi:hypothetical protein
MRSREQTLAQRPIVCLALLLVYEPPFYPESPEDARWMVRTNEAWELTLLRLLGTCDRYPRS